MRHFCLCVVATAAGQQAPAPSAATQPTSANDVIELSPFEVTTDQDVGYLATNTLAGSRFNTALKDTPATISVLTAEFLSDISAFTLEEAMAYAVNVEFDLDDSRESVINNGVFQSYQGYRTRGLEASRSRNYFGGNRAPDEMALVERIEDSRGPNSVLFGMGSPGGVINTSTKQAVLGRAFQRGTFTYGSYDSKRVTLDLNQPLLDKKLGLRLNLVYNDANTFREWQHRIDQRAQIALKYQIREGTRIRMELERGQVEDNTPVSFNLLDTFSTWDAAGRPTFATRTVNAALGINQQPNNVRVTYVSNNASAFNDQRNNLGSMITQGTGNPIQDRNLVDYSVNHGGPGQNRYSRIGDFSTFFEHQLGKNTFIELAYNHAEHSFDNRDPRGSRRQMLGDPNQRYANGSANPFVGQLYLEAQWFRTTRWDRSDTGRATFSHEVDAGKWGNYRFGAYTEYEKGFTLGTTYRELWVDAATGLPAFNAIPDNANNNVFRRSYPTLGDWASYHVNGPVGSGGLLENIHDPITNRTLDSYWGRNAAPTETYSTKKSGMVVTQARFFKGRVVFAGGLRRDEYDEMQVGRWRDPNTQEFAIQRDPSLATTPPTENSAIGRTKTLGLVYHVTRWVSLSYNWADNVSVPARGNTMLHPSGDPLLDPVPVPKPHGQGEDFGVGVSLFEDRVYLKATVYKTQGRDQSITAASSIKNQGNTAIMDTLLLMGLISQDEHDKRTDLGGQGLFGHESTGYELQLTGNVTKNWRLQAGYATVSPVENYRWPEWSKWLEHNERFLSQFDQSIVVYQGFDIANRRQFFKDELANEQSAVGVSKLGTRKHKYTLFTRYNFSTGPLKGLFVGGGYRHQSKMFIGVDSVTRAPRYGNSFWYADALAGYTVSGLRKGRRLSFQLNVNNVFNERDPLILRYDGDTNNVLREAIRPPTTWKLTTSFEY